MDNVFYLYLWYAIAVVVAFFVLWHQALGGMPAGIAFLIATIFGLVLGLFLMPYYRKPKMNVDDQRWLMGFVVLSIVLPVVGLIWVLASSETRNYGQVTSKDNASDVCNVEAVMACDGQTGDCVPVAAKETCDNSTTFFKFF